ncbi:MAG TPA: hypothetical protein EYP85_13580, partial [Armatimonadetes bacterium]|nr:hypothetical protein [Armatimonadota bacterium]
MQRAWLVIFTLIALGLGRPSAVVGFPAQPPGENLARGKPYQLEPRPNYRYCTDPGDATQLTDGEYSVGYFWVQKSTVGWSRARPVIITLDLGKVEPIGGLAYNTAAGTAGVGWPMAIFVLVSEEGKKYYYAGDLVALSAEHGLPAPEGYAVHRFWTDKLRTHGRYLKLVIAQGGPYTFVDEIEVYRGPEALLSQPYEGEPVADVREFFLANQVNAAVKKRLTMDLMAVREAMKQATLPPATRQRLQNELAEIEKALAELPPVDPAQFRAVVPFNDLHRRIFRLQAALWEAEGRPPLTVWAGNRWDPLSPSDLPPAGATRPRLEVAMMRNEYRSAAFNLTNASQREQKVRLRLEGLPGGPNPDYVTVHEVQWTDTREGVLVAAALPEALKQGEYYLISVPAGLTRQVWLTFHPVEVAEGNYRGRIVLRPPGREEIGIPLRLRLFPFRFPTQPTLHLGGWDYTDTERSYDVGPENRAALIAHLREHFVDTPWAHAGVLSPGEFDEQGRMLAEPDYRQFDAWVKRWPGARIYAVFLSVGRTFAGSPLGTPEFERKVAAWISAWVRHLKQIGLRANQLALLLVDEPSRPEQDEVILAWAKAIKAAEPGVIIWEDPVHRDPWQANREMMETCDVLCPNRPAFLTAAQSYRDFYLQQREQGRELWFYSCSGPVRLLDPYSYHRLQHWTCWQYGAKGSGFWAFGDSGGGSSWNEYACPRVTYTPLFLDATSVTAGKHLEAVREGVEDYEYLVMLQQQIAEWERRGWRGERLERAKKLLA